MSLHFTIADVARAAGISCQTVSRVLNSTGEISNVTLRHAQEVVDWLDDRFSSIARGPATRHTCAIGLIVPDIANPYFAAISQS